MDWWKGPLEIEGHISIGELTLAVVTSLSAWYVGSSLKRKQDRDAALRELMRFFCRESLGLVTSAGDILDEQLARSYGAALDEAGRSTIRTALLRLSNSIHAIDSVIEKSSRLTGHAGRREKLGDLKTAHEVLSQQIVSGW